MFVENVRLDRCGGGPILVLKIHKNIKLATISEHECDAQYDASALGSI